MDQNQDIPSLIRFYFGDSAAHAQRAASSRLCKWSRAFEDWMEERKRDYQKDAVKQAMLAWRRFIRQCGKMPWEVSKEDIEAHADWMRAEGFAKPTINCAIGILSSFYMWCEVHRVDRLCDPGFNPANEAARMKIRRYEGASLWSKEEVEVFLDLMRRDESVLGKREYAFFLLRISVGVPLKSLQRLDWDQIEQEESGAWVRWVEGEERVRLPDPVWQAVREYLQASGRLEGMRRGKYIFTPLAQPGKEVTGNRAEDWQEEQQLSGSAMLDNLKLYGRRVGIAEEKLTLMALRRTAIRIKMGQGENLKGMQVFMGCREEIKSTKYRLKRLSEIQEDNTIEPGERSQEVEVPIRSAKPFKEGENIRHGMYAHKKDMQAVRAVMAEDIHGLDQEIACLRQLMKGLLEREGDDLHQVEAYSQAARRLGELLPAGEDKGREKQNTWAEDFLSKLDELSIRQGQPIVSPQIRQNALGLSPGLVGATGRIVEEAATLRLMLRNVYRHALLQVGRREYVHLVDLYGLGCVRLSRLLKLGGGDDNSQLERYLRLNIDKAIRYLTREWHLDGGD